MTDTARPPQPSPSDGWTTSGWTTGRVVSVVIGALLAIMCLGLVIGGGAVLVWNATQREDGYLTSSEFTATAPGYALTSERVDIGGSVRGGWQTKLLGRIRIHVTARDPGQAVFIGIANTSAVRDYLAGVGYSTVREIDGRIVRTAEQAGTAPRSAPSQAQIWVASTQGTATQTLTWKVRGGPWSVVVLNADASSGVEVTFAVGATLPALPWIGGGLLVAGLLCGVGAVALIATPLVRVGHDRR